VIDGQARATRINRLAVWSVIASAVTLFGIGSLLGVALGVVAWNQATVRGERGRGLAVAGIALGAITLLVSMIAIVKWVGTP
jgi:hypothetical protein